MTNSSALPILDRSRAQLRLPADLLTESLRIAHALSLSTPDTDPSSHRSDEETMSRLETDGIIVDNRFDPIVAEILGVVNEASLMVAVDLRCGIDASVPTIWATPRYAVISSSLDPTFVEFRPVDVAQLPLVLGELVVLRSPRFVGEAPISIGTEVLNQVAAVADRDGSGRDTAIEALTSGGLAPEQAERVLRFLDDQTRTWEITSTWSTEGGQEMAELKGLDAGANGQWLRASTGGDNGTGQVTYTPQGHGEVMKAFRSVLPRNWFGTPLNRPPV